MDEVEVAALHRLCARYGIATFYGDVFGVRHEVAPEALAALLRDAGFLPAGQGLVQGEASAESADWAHHLPPVQVVPAGAESFTVALCLPLVTGQFHWRLVDEAGAVREGALETAGLHVLDEGAGRRRYALPLALALPEGYHRFSVVGLPGETLLVAAPARCHQPAVLQDGGRVWGFTLQLHSLRSRRNWGFGDFTDLADFIDGAARRGADVIGLNPLHALFAHNPAHLSPYSPSSRAHLTVLYID
ncbi:MAG TPA: 4-alpha-glucanotransferase, partial [Variovorax sp.]